jgi:hypothetical protein
MKLIDKRLIQNVPIGGAPMFIDDIVRIQENASAETNASFRFFVDKIPNYNIGVISPAGTDIIDWGLLLSKPTIDATVIGATVIGEFMFFANDRIHYFGGGVFDFTVNEVVYFYPNDDAFETRVFNDAGSKNLFTENTVSFIYGNFQNVTIETPVPAGKQAVRIGYFNISNEFGVVQNVATYPSFDDVFTTRAELSSVLQKVKPAIRSNYLFGAGGVATAGTIFDVNFVGGVAQRFATRTGILHYSFSVAIKGDSTFASSGVETTMSIQVNNANVMFKRFQVTDRFQDYSIQYVGAPVNQGDEVNVIINFGGNVVDTKFLKDGNDVLLIY